MTVGPETVILDDKHAHEALDRTHLIVCMVDDFLMEHPFISQQPELQEKATSIENELAQLYQMIGQLYNDKYDPKTRTD